MPSILKDNRDGEVQPAAPPANPEQRQRRRMFIALGVLLVALIVVLIRDRQIWMPAPPASESASDQSTSQEPISDSAPNPVASAVSREGLPHPPTATTGKKESRPLKTNQPAALPQEAPAPVIAATDRAVLPPLEVEVVAGNEHRALAPANNPVKVEMQSESSPPPAPAPVPQSAAASNPDNAHVVLSHDITERVSRSVEPNYPLLAKQMKVQGAVVLQALIDKTGNIEDLHVITGPTILAAAAREAVKQWHFKPYYQNGQAVETEARITVNFTISTY